VAAEDHLGNQFKSKLSLEGAISVAEQAMERGGNAGATMHIPQGHVDDPAHQAAMAPVREQVRGWTHSVNPEAAPHVRINASDYMLDRYGGQAMAQGDHIYTRPKTNQMSVLHEVAHVATNTQHGGHGHTPEFARTAHSLYSQHISPEAGDHFWGLIEPHVLAAERERQD
jgi:hypothetical protein